jgi:ubiquinone/menaquinone biosynthesis C-methylase UbiE
MPPDDVYAEILARNYDEVYAVIRDPSGDAAFYRQMAHRAGGPVLELGCGTGRVLLPIARDGIGCVGLDASPAMLEILRAKAPPPNLELVLGRMEQFDFGERRFSLITMPFRAMSHLHDVETQLAALDCIRRHLAPSGVFAFDVFDPKLERMALAAEPEHIAAKFMHDGVEIRRWDSVQRDHSRQVMKMRFRFEGGPPETTGSGEVQMRWFYRFELEHLLVRGGFSRLTFFGGFDGRPWRAGGETIVLAATNG